MACVLQLIKYTPMHIIVYTYSLITDVWREIGLALREDQYYGPNN